MAFVQKKKEEALEKRVSGYLSPASEASIEEEEIKKPKVIFKLIKVTFSQMIQGQVFVFIPYQRLGKGYQISSDLGKSYR